MTGAEQQIFTSAEAAEYLKVHRSTIAREVRLGRLKACHVGRVLRITRRQLDEYLNGEVAS